MSGVIYFDRYELQHNYIPIHIHRFQGRMDSPQFNRYTLDKYFKDLSRNNKNSLNLTYYNELSAEHIESLMRLFQRCGGLGLCIPMMDQTDNIKSFDVFYDETDPNAPFVLGHEIGHIMNSDCDTGAFRGRSLFQEMLADNYAFKHFGNQLRTKPDFFVNDNLNKEGPSSWLEMWRTFGNESIIRQANINRKWDELHGPRD